MNATDSAYLGTVTETRQRTKKRPTVRPPLPAGQSDVALADINVCVRPTHLDASKPQPVRAR